MLNMLTYARRRDEIIKEAKALFDEADIAFQLPDNPKDIVRIVFAGPYSAGKSTILKALTGQNNIRTGVAITTEETTTYDWNGIQVIDTPGINTGIREDHDAISYEAIAQADMLLYVITSEGFSSHVAENFRKLAIDNEKAKEMILVVNKMDMTALGNCDEQRRVILEDPTFLKVIHPYSPEELYLSFLDMDSYWESEKEGDSDPEAAQELLKDSGFEVFIDNLNRFVSDKGKNAKLTTVLTTIRQKLEDAIRGLQPQSTDRELVGLEENCRQHRHILMEARNRMTRQIRDIFNNATTEIRNLGLEAANLLQSGSNKEELEARLKETVREVDAIAEKCQSEAREVTENGLNEIQKQLNDLENSEFSTELKIRLSSRFDTLPEGVRRIMTAGSEGLRKAGTLVADNAYKAGVQGGLKLTNFSTSNIHQAVLNIGHFFGHTFRPWEALKITQKVLVGSQILSFLGVGMSVFMQIKSDSDETKQRKELKTDRQTIRAQFTNAANALQDYGESFIRKNIDEPLRMDIEAVDKEIQEIRSTRDSRSELCTRMESLQQRCQQLIRDINS